MTREEAHELVARLMAAWPRQAVEASTVEVYVRALGDLDHRAAREAVSELILAAEWFPTVAAIRRAVAERTLGLPSAAEAWALVNDPDRRRVALGWVEYDDDAEGTGEVRHEPENTAAAELLRGALDHVGGTWELRHTNAPHVTRREFMAEYDRRRDDALRVAMLPPALTGRAAGELERGAS